MSLIHAWEGGSVTKYSGGERKRLKADEFSGLGNTNGGRFTTFAGGLPIKNSKGEVLGAVSFSAY